MEAPAKVRALVAERERARGERDFIRADALRDEIAACGWLVRDQADGPVLEALPKVRRMRPSEVTDRLGEPASLTASVLLLHEGFVEDLARFLHALVAHHDLSSIETIVVDPGSDDAEAIVELCAPLPNASVLALTDDLGWAANRNLAIRASRGATTVIADLSIEPTGDILTPLLEAIEAGAPVAGPIGVVTDDLFTWHEAAGETCDAIEAYLLATRRDLLRDAGLIDERFTWYRNADLALSLALRDAAGGAPARRVGVPFRKHEHRGFRRYPDEDARDRISRRNYNLLLERWRGSTELLTGAPARA